jgi:anti-sigma factor RsiW
MASRRAEGKSSPCPASETIAALVDGFLGASERAVVLGHVVTCDACAEVVAEVTFAQIHLVNRAPTPRWRRGRSLLH